MKFASLPKTKRTRNKTMLLDEGRGDAMGRSDILLKSTAWIAGHGGLMMADTNCRQAMLERAEKYQLWC